MNYVFQLFFSSSNLRLKLLVLFPIFLLSLFGCGNDGLEGFDPDAEADFFTEDGAGSEWLMPKMYRITLNSLTVGTGSFDSLVRTEPELYGRVCVITSENEELFQDIPTDQKLMRCQNLWIQTDNDPGASSIISSILEVTDNTEALLQLEDLNSILRGPSDPPRLPSGTYNMPGSNGIENPNTVQVELKDYFNQKLIILVPYLGDDDSSIDDPIGDTGVKWKYGDYK